MAAAIPAAVSLGGSIFSGISGKKAAKAQQRQAEEYMKLLRPLMEMQIQGGKYALEAARPIIGQSAESLLGAGQATRDLQNFWRPLAFGNRSAIDQFLAPERRAINEGYRSQVQDLAQFAPRGGGRLSAIASANRQRQGQLNDLVFGARKEGAGQLGNLARLLSEIGGQQGGIGSSLLASGQGAGQQAFNLLQGQQARAYQAGQAASQNWGSLGEQIGGFLTDIFPGTFKRAQSRSAGNVAGYGTTAGGKSLYE